MRNVLANVPKGSSEMVAAAIRTIFAQPDTEHVHEQFDVIAMMLGRQSPKVEDMLHEAKGDLLAFAAFPQSHWRQIWSTNPLERLNKELNAAPTSVGVFPNPSPYCGFQGQSWPNNTTNGSPVTVAIQRGKHDTSEHPTRGKRRAGEPTELMTA